MRILIIEDDKQLGELMKKALVKFGFSVDWVVDGQGGEEKLYINTYDTILLDLNLPDKDGIQIIKDIRREEIITPIIIVSARDAVKERALALDMGADDYIVKPFDFMELRSRINAVIRRFYGRVNTEIKIGDLVIDPKVRSVTYNGQEVKLSAKEFDILEYVASNHPNVISSEDITEHVYDEFYDPFSSVLRVHISRVKKKLSIVAGQEVMMTVKGKGYKLWEEK